METQETTLTFLYTDIQGSTRLWEHQPEAMRQAVSRHDQIMRQAIEGHAGRVFRTIGDAFCAVFSTAPDALQAAVMAQRALAQETWSLEEPILVRMAVHTGKAAEQEGDYVGASLNHIGRLIAACHGGQIVLTLVTEQLVRDQLPQGVQLTDLGQHRFRDLIHPEHIFQADIDELPSSFPPLKSLETHPNNFPSLLTVFIGREQQMQAIAKLVASSRLVTLSGPGGTGKTRLSLEIANRIVDQYPDGAWLVELAPISNPRLLIQAVAMALNVHEQPGRSLQAVLIDAIQSRRLLLVLDNCEHLVEAAAQLTSELLNACPQLKVIASSREMLGIPGEMVYRVPSLSLPDLDQQATFEEIAQSEAVRLFVSRAAALRPGFELTSQNARAIHQICVRLDGIPLAIELAAARASVLNPEQIATRLDDRFRLLTGGSRTALPRQQTLEALFDWSYDLLSESEQRFFRRLSVFSGGWTLEAAEVVGGDPYALDLLEQLINKSLVVVDWLDQGSRYRMLETSRQYALKKLLEAGEAADIRQAHLAYFSAFSNQQRLLLLRDFERLVHQYLPEKDNLHAALDWGIDHDLEAALGIASSLGYVWPLIGLAGEMRVYLRRAIEQANQRPEFRESPLLVNALMTESIQTINLGHNQEALQILQATLELARQVDDPTLLAEVLSALSQAAGLTGDAELAHHSSEESISIARRAGQPWLIEMILFQLISFTMIPLGDFQTARKYADELQQVMDRNPSLIHTTMSDQVLGVLDFYDGQYERAREHFTSSLESFSKVGGTALQTVSLSGLADIARLQKRYQEASELYRRVIQSWRDFGNLGAVARNLECLAFIAGEQALTSDQEFGQMQLQQAGLWLGAAEKIRQETSSWMNPIEREEYDRFMAKLKDFANQQPSLQSAFEQSWIAGQRSGLGVIAQLR